MLSCLTSSAWATLMFWIQSCQILCAYHMNFLPIQVQSHTFRRLPSPHPFHVLLMTCPPPTASRKATIIIDRHSASPTSSFISVLTMMCIPHLFGAIDPTSLLKWMCWNMVHGAYLFIHGNRLGKMDQAKPICSVTASKEPWVLFRKMSFFSFPGQFKICYIP